MTGVQTCALPIWLYFVRLDPRCASEGNAMNPSLVDILSPRIKPLDLDNRLLLIREFIPGRIIFTTSFGIEDQLITHSIFTQALDIEIATIDTGRLFPETYELWERTEARYAPSRPGNRQALRSRQGFRSAATALDRRTHHRMAQSGPTVGKRLGEPEPKSARLPPTRLHPPHAAKTMQSLMMLPDIL